MVARGGGGRRKGERPTPLSSSASAPLLLGIVLMLLLPTWQAVAARWWIRVNRWLLELVEVFGIFW
jgi:hypothetical protein